MKKTGSILILGILIISSFGVQALSNNFLSLNDENIGDTFDITWEKHVIDNEVDYIFGVHAADVDLDGDCDVLGATQEGDSIAWWRNDGENPLKWTKQIIDDQFDGATSVFAIDIDGDTDIDIVGSASYANEIAIWLNNGDTVEWTKQTIATNFDFAHEVYCFDLDEDGDIDILGSSSDDHQIAWFCNDGGDPIIWTKNIIDDLFLGAKSARVADINNDGLLDVIGAAIMDNTISWWEYIVGNPSYWKEYVIDDDFTGAHRVEVCDLDFDGDIDVIGTAIFGDEISWFRNEGGTPITWTKQIITKGFDKACIGLPVDIDEDNDIDVIGTAIYGNEVALFRNDGGEPIMWTKILIDSLFHGAWPGFIADIDSDGDNDILAGASFADSLAWWQNDLSKPPTKPEKPSGPSTGSSGTKYSFKTVSSDPNDDQLYYMWSWGHDEYSNWIGPYDSEEECTTHRTWDDEGTYEIKVKVKDEHGLESEWSDSIEVILPKYKEIESFFIRLLESHPSLFPFLQRLIGLK